MQWVESGAAVAPRMLGSVIERGYAGLGGSPVVGDAGDRGLCAGGAAGGRCGGCLRCRATVVRRAV